MIFSSLLSMVKKFLNCFCLYQTSISFELILIKEKRLRLGLSLFSNFIFFHVLYRACLLWYKVNAVFARPDGYPVKRCLESVLDRRVWHYYWSKFLQAAKGIFNAQDIGACWQIIRRERDLAVGFCRTRTLDPGTAGTIQDYLFSVLDFYERPGAVVFRLIN